MLRRSLPRGLRPSRARGIGDGIVTPGPFAVGQNLAEYPLPPSLAGKRVLDVGCSNGFISFEFERRGAREVVAIDLPSWTAHDWSPRKQRGSARCTPEQVAGLGPPLMRSPFELVARELGSTRVRRRELTVYDLDPQRDGCFDLVFSGALLMHLRDPVLALEAMRSVCEPDGSIVVSVATTRPDDPEPVAMFVGAWDRANYWRMSPACVH